MNQRKLVQVRDVMKSEFDIVDGMTTVKDALLEMKHQDTKCLIIEKRHANDEYGIVMLSDIARKVLAQDKAPERVNVYEIMTKPVICVSAEMDIRYCARLFEQFGLSRAPVTQGDDEITGIISYTDMVLRGLCNQLE